MVQAPTRAGADLPQTVTVNTVGTSQSYEVRRTLERGTEFYGRIIEQLSGTSNRGRFTMRLRQSIRMVVKKTHKLI